MDQEHDHVDEHEVDEHDAFVSLLMRYHRVLRAHLRSMLSTLIDVDEGMPEVSIAAWRRLADRDAPEKIHPWASGIARIELLRFRRTKARNRAVLGEDAEQLIEDDGIGELDAREVCVQTFFGRAEKSGIQGLLRRSAMSESAYLQRWGPTKKPRKSG